MKNLKAKLGGASRGVALGVVLLGLLCHITGAAPLPPATLIPALPEPDPIGGVLLNSVAAPFASVDIQGQVVSQVLIGDGSNPYGGLTFTYQIIMSALSPHEVSGFSVGNFGGFLTDVSFNPGVVPGGIAPMFVNRSSFPGDVVRFIYSPGIAAGQSSALMVVQTDAQNYQPTLASVINSGSAVVDSFAPVQVPEPGAVALAMLGGMALLRLQWRLRR